MKEELIAEVTQQMLPCLNNSQLKQLRQVLNHIFIHYEITDIKTNPIEDYVRGDRHLYPLFCVKMYCEMG